MAGGYENGNMLHAMGGNNPTRTLGCRIVCKNYREVSKGARNPIKCMYRRRADINRVHPLAA